MSPQYRFKAKDRQGETISDLLGADSRNDALDRLHARNLVPLQVQEIRDSRLKLKKSALKLLHGIGYRPYSNRDMMIFCRQFATMLKAGITMLQCLRILSRQAEIANLNKQVWIVSLEVEEGSSLAAAMRNHYESFPAIMINMVEVGETGGELDMIMERVADHFEKQHDLQEKIRSATLYPAFIIGVALIVVMVMVIFVLPQFSQIFNSLGMEMPFYTRLLLSGGNLIREYWLLVLLALVSALASLSWYGQTKKGKHKFDQIRLHFPLFGKIYRLTLSARFSRILGTLLAGGVTLHASLILVDRIIDNAVVSKSIGEISRAIVRGETIADPLQKIKYFPPLLSEMVRIGEETGTLENSLHSTAKFYEREISYFVERLSTILEPVLLLCVGLFIGLLIFSILSPMYRIFEMI